MAQIGKGADFCAAPFGRGKAFGDGSHCNVFDSGSSDCQ
jgi:hypothetical protein